MLEVGSIVSLRAHVCDFKLATNGQYAIENRLVSIRSMIGHLDAVELQCQMNISKHHNLRL